MTSPRLLASLLQPRSRDAACRRRWDRARRACCRRAPGRRGPGGHALHAGAPPRRQGMQLGDRGRAHRRARTARAPGLLRGAAGAVGQGGRRRSRDHRLEPGPLPDLRGSGRRGPPPLPGGVLPGIPGSRSPVHGLHRRGASEVLGVLRLCRALCDARRPRGLVRHLSLRLGPAEGLSPQPGDHQRLPVEPRGPAQLARGDLGLLDAQDPPHRRAGLHQRRGLHPGRRHERHLVGAHRPPHRGPWWRAPPVLQAGRHRARRRTPVGPHLRLASAARPRPALRRGDHPHGARERVDRGGTGRRRADAPCASLAGGPRSRPRPAPPARAARHRAAEDHRAFGPARLAPERGHGRTPPSGPPCTSSARRPASMASPSPSVPACCRWRPAGGPWAWP